MEAERLRKKELQRIAGLPENEDDDDMVSVVSEMDNEINDEILDKEAATPLMVAPSTSSEQTMTSLTLENGNTSTNEEPTKESSVNPSQESSANPPQETATQPAPTDQPQQQLESGQASQAVADEKKKKKKNEMTEEMLQKELQSKLVWESVELVKKPEEDLCWILVEPRLPSK
ncbi:hypothetical protein RFI_12841 [Reticulomyxa filosa]|uniref:Uncharacterized protein n=1 Tax=Reticulomyxa filosa TaxID=46433 RepID=X6NDB0_RETFI|nr:hypothetical protein RFI_12841 [Reticulomyxa filosa]|eukprot:ETO24315.1 hypothetical protein RFI_12841 [Reticulomyxa filosa]